MKVITISGKAQHGKDTFANMLKEQIEQKGKTAQIVKFADGVKEIAREKGWNGEKDNNGRVLLQFIGTEWGRQQIDKNIWVKKAENKFQNVDYVLIPDCRFENEANYFADNGYEQVNIRVVRINYDGSEYQTLNSKQQKHPSETGLDNFEFNYVIVAKNLEHLEYSATKVFNQLEEE